MHAVQEISKTKRRVPRPFPGGFLMVMIALFVIASTGLYSADSYVRSASLRLHTALPSSESFDYAVAEQWAWRDAERLEKLVNRWPISIPTILGEMIFLAYERRQVEESADTMDRGFAIVSPPSAGKSHLLSVSIRARVLALTHGWNRREVYFDWMTYNGHPISPQTDGIPAEESDVVHILDELALPDHVFTGLKIVLLPFVLEGTAGLGTKNEVVVGAAPRTTSMVARERTAYTLLHELGHHIHFTYFDPRSAQTSWNKYLSHRGIEQHRRHKEIPFVPWDESPEETFAEDFRMLFGPFEARTVPHGTVYGDPTATSDGGLATRRLILERL